MIKRPDSLNLTNWRQPPHNRWAFHHVREIVPTAPIFRGNQTDRFTSAPVPSIGEVTLTGLEGAQWSLERWLSESSSDALLVAHRGQLVHE